jgi:hypothetical protein
LDFQSEGTRCFRHVSSRGLSSRDIGWIDQHSNPNGLRHQVVQQPQPLGCNVCKEKIDAGCVATWPGNAGDKTEFDRVGADGEDNRDCRGRSVRRKSSRIAGRSGNNSYAAAD